MFETEERKYISNKIHNAGVLVATLAGSVALLSLVAFTKLAGLPLTPERIILAFVAGTTFFCIAGAATVTVLRALEAIVWCTPKSNIKE